MAAPVRQSIIDEVEAELKKILKVNGFKTDAGRNVFEWRDTESSPITDDERPAIVYRDLNSPVALDYESVTTHIHDLSVEIELFVSGVEAPADLRNLIADVNDAIRATNTTAGRKTWGGYAIDTFPEAEDIVAAEGGKRLMGGLIRVRIQYHTAKFDSYTQ